MENSVFHPLAFLVLSVLLPSTDEQCSEAVLEQQIHALDLCQNDLESITKLIEKESVDVETNCRAAINDKQQCFGMAFGRLKTCQSSEEELALEAFRQSELAQTKYYCQENGKNLKLFWKYEGLTCLKGSSVKTNCSIPKPRVVVRPSIKNCRGRREYLDCYKSILHPKHCSEYAKKFLVSAVEAFLKESSCSPYLGEAFAAAATNSLILLLCFLLLFIY